jgi:acyl carrier protein phosphodiesterase
MTNDSGGAFGQALAGIRSSDVIVTVRGERLHRREDNFTDQVELLKSARMPSDDWQRTVVPAFLLRVFASRRRRRSGPAWRSPRSSVTAFPKVAA